jgi:serine protease Do
MTNCTARGPSARSLLLLLGILFFASGAPVCPAPDGSSPSTDLRRLDDKEAAALGQSLEQLNARLAPSVVRFFNPKRDGNGFSGVIISRSGQVLTCAHHHLPPRTKIAVELADGRKVNGTILGSIKQKDGAVSTYHAADIGLIQLNGESDWPSVELGRGADLRPGDLCLGLGYPNVHEVGQLPLLRLGRNLTPLACGMMRTTCRIHPGDSGGPLFDLAGRVVGVHTSMESLKEGINWHSPVENFLTARDRLSKGEDVECEKDLSAKWQQRTDHGGAWAAADELRDTLRAVSASVVEVLSDGKTIALGLIVDADGCVLTKRSELMGPRGPRPIVCRLKNGAQLEARKMAESREHDLALLKVTAKNLPAVRWAKSGPLRAGQLVVSLGPGPEPLSYGVVAAARVKSPGGKGELPISVKSAPADAGGVAFVELRPKRLDLDEVQGSFQAGDLITHLGDIPTPSVAAFDNARDALIALEGEWIKLAVMREKKPFDVFVPLIGGPLPIPIPWRDARWNMRHNGFPEVFCHDGAVAFDRCGGPVVNRQGEVIGINIARADPIRSFAIPSDVAQQVIAELRKR